MGGTKVLSVKLLGVCACAVLVEHCFCVGYGMSWEVVAVLTCDSNFCLCLNLLVCPTSSKSAELCICGWF